MLKFIDTDSNLKKVSNTNIKDKKGNITSYGFHCGYIERFDKTEYKTITLHFEHSIYHIISYDVQTNVKVWETVETVKEARKIYNKLKR